MRFGWRSLGKSTTHFAELERYTTGRKWGAVFLDAPPVSQGELTAARDQMLREAQQPFVLVRPDVRRVTTTREAIARDTAFRSTLLAQYKHACAISGIALTSGSIHEVEAAHIVRLDRGGADEPRNGFLLTRTLHWAFDRGLFGIDADRRVIVPPAVARMADNEWLRQFAGRSVREPHHRSLRIRGEAFEWHRTNLMWS